MTRCKIIAEVSANHCNSLIKAYSLIEAAAECGADYVKFQIYDSFNDIELLQGVDYPKHILEAAERDMSLISQYQVPREWMPLLLDKAKASGIEIIYSCSDESMLSFVRTYSSVPTLKVASCDATNLRLLAHAADLFNELIISTGALSLSGIKSIYRFLTDYCGFKGDITFLYCVSKYPCSIEDVHLGSIQYLREATGLSFGYSDHFKGIAACISALPYKPVYIEKHFQLLGSDSVDSCVSCDPTLLREIVSSTFLSQNIDPSLNVETRNHMYIRSAYMRSNSSSFDDISFIRPGFGLDVQSAVAMIIGKRVSMERVNEAWPKLSDGALDL